MTIVSGAVAILVTGLHTFGYFESWEARWIDSMGILFRPTPTGAVAVVAITDDDFRRPDLFNSVSPLDPRGLQRVFERVAAHRPALIAVDIYVDPVPHEPADRAAARRGLYESLLALVTHSNSRWMLLASEHELAADGIDPAVAAAWRALQRAGDELPQRLAWASPEIPVESGLIRHVPLVSHHDTRIMPTVLGAIVAGHEAGARHQPVEHHHPILVRYTGAFTVDSANSLSAYGVSAGQLLAPQAAPRSDTLLTGKIVIVGGVHEAGHDFHWTPIGRIAAMQVWAEATDSWLRRDSPREPPWWLAILLETAVGFLGGLVMHRFDPIVGYGLILVVLAPLTLALSALAFGTGIMFINFLPSFFAVRLHQGIELKREYRRLQEKVERLEKRAAGLRDELRGDGE